MRQPFVVRYSIESGPFGRRTMLEHAFQCPYCWEQITMLLDTSVQGQTYVEDCEVCCRPITIRYRVAGKQLQSFRARPAYR